MPWRRVAGPRLHIHSEQRLRYERMRKFTPELHAGRVDPRVGSGQISCKYWVGSGRLGSMQCEKLTDTGNISCNSRCLVYTIMTRRTVD